MNSSMSGSGGEASRKTQLLTSLAILSTYSERGPGGKLALAPTEEMHILVKLMAAASLGERTNCYRNISIPDQS